MSGRRLPTRNVARWDRLARKYHDEVVSPFAAQVDFRLGRDVAACISEWSAAGSLTHKVVLDLGVGCGESMLTHGGRAGLSIGLDFSPGMLRATADSLAAIGIEVDGLRTLPASARAARRVHERGRANFATQLVHGDMRDLGPLHDLADLVLAINSITDGHAPTSATMFEQSASCVRPGGLWIAVFPALDAVEYLDRLCRAGDIDLDHLSRVSYPDGVYVDSSGLRQKYYLPDEIARACTAHGLRMLRIEKILYPWRMMRECGWGYFPRRPRLWDWYAVAERPTTSAKARRSPPPRVRLARVRRRGTVPAGSST